MPSHSVENYLKTIHKLGQINGDRVKTKDIADKLELALPSVTSMLKTLARQGYLDYVPYQGVHLTEAGVKAALKVVRKHRLIELFLVRTLDLDWSEVHEEAELLEHALSDKLTERIDAFLNFPRRDPHGDPIPTKDGEIPAQVGTLLTDVNLHETVQVQRVLTQNSEVLRYLNGKGINIAVALQVVEFAPFGGPVTVELVEREERVSLGRQMAELLRVCAATGEGSDAASPVGVS